MFGWYRASTSLLSSTSCFTISTSTNPQSRNASRATLNFMLTSVSFNEIQCCSCRSARRAFAVVLDGIHNVQQMLQQLFRFAFDSFAAVLLGDLLLLLTVSELSQTNHFALEILRVFNESVVGHVS